MTTTRERALEAALRDCIAELEAMRENTRPFVEPSQIPVDRARAALALPPAPDAVAALRNLYLATGPMTDPEVEAFWEAMAEDHANTSRTSQEYIDEARANALKAIARATAGHAPADKPGPSSCAWNDQHEQSR